MHSNGELRSARQCFLWMIFARRRFFHWNALNRFQFIPMGNRVSQDDVFAERINNVLWGTTVHTSTSQEDILYPFRCFGLQIPLALTVLDIKNCDTLRRSRELTPATVLLSHGPSLWNKPPIEINHLLPLSVFRKCIKIELYIKVPFNCFSPLTYTHICLNLFILFECKFIYQW